MVNGFKFIYNVPYEPQYNPIEYTFSIIKRNFKCLRAQKFIDLVQDSHEALLRKAVTKVKK